MASNGPRRRDHLWKPGQSGNPSGKPKGIGDVAAAARAHTLEAIATLVTAMKDPRLCVAAATALLDRGWGKPAQTLSLRDDNPAVIVIEGYGARELEAPTNGKAPAGPNPN